MRNFYQQWLERRNRPYRNGCNRRRNDRCQQRTGTPWRLAETLRSSGFEPADRFREPVCCPQPDHGCRLRCRDRPVDACSGSPASWYGHAVAGQPDPEQRAEPAALSKSEGLPAAPEDWRRQGHGSLLPCPFLHAAGECRIRRGFRPLIGNSPAVIRKYPVGSQDRPGTIP